MTLPVFRRAAITAFRALLLTTCLTSSVFAWDRDQGPLWPDGTITLDLHLGETPIYASGRSPNQIAAEALAVWNPMMARVQFVARPNSSPNPSFGNRLNNVTFDSTVIGTEWGPGVLAVAITHYDSTRRIESDVIVNANLAWDHYDGSWRNDRKDLRRVLIHEFGHVLGLDHPDEAGQHHTAIMNSTASYIADLQADDLDGVGALYGYTPSNPGRPPELTTAFEPITIETGLTLTLSVANTTGSYPMTYQWFKDGALLPGFTTVSIEKPNVSPSDAGNYHAVITNAAGSLTTPPFVVTVVEPIGPRIASPERNVFNRVTAGTYFSLPLHVVGSEPFNYQWFRNGLPIPGGTGPSYGVANTSDADAGIYHVVVSNAAGTASSPTYTIEVEPVAPPFYPDTRYAINAPKVFVIEPGPVSAEILRRQWRGADALYFNGIKIADGGHFTAAVQYGVAQPGEYLLVSNNSAGRGTSFAYRLVYNLSDPVNTTPVPAIPPESSDLFVDRTMLDRRGNLLLFSRFHRHIWVWSLRESRFIATLPLWGHANAVAYHPAWDRVLLTYADGRITQLDTAATSATETVFATVNETGVDLHPIEDHLLVRLRSGTQATHLLYRSDGTIHETRSGWQPSQDIAWNPLHRRLYHGVAGSLSYALFSVGLSPDHRFTDSQFAEYQGQRFVQAPLVVSPDGNQLLSATGDIFDAVNLQPLRTLPRPHQANLWTHSGLFTATTNTRGATISRIHPKTYAVERSAQIPGHSPELFATDQGQIVATSISDDRVIISTFDADLRPLTRMTHRGIDLLATRAKLSNLSTRVSLPDSGDGILTAGFVINGTQPLRVLVRAIGPGLQPFNIQTYLGDPSLKLFAADQTLVAANDSWSPANDVDRQALFDLFNQLGAFIPDTGGKDAALLITLPPGPYSAQVARGIQPGGVVLLEIYDASFGTSTSTLSNVSTRMDAGSGEQTLVTGFVVEGDSDRSLLVRAAGPSLGRFGVTGVLGDPLLKVHQGSTLVGQNNDWAGAETVNLAARAAGAFDFHSPNSRDSALLITLPPGAYTAQVTGADEAEAGNALIEVYQIDN